MCLCVYMGLHVFQLNTVYLRRIASLFIVPCFAIIVDIHCMAQSCSTPVSFTIKTHCDLLPLTVNDLPCEVQLHKRFVSFFNSVCRSTSQLTRICSRLCIVGSN